MKLLTLVTRHLEQLAKIPTKVHGDPPRASTMQAKRLHLERFATNFDNTHEDAGELTINDCIDWINGIAHTSVSNVNQALTAISGFISFLAREKMLDWNDKTAWDVHHKERYYRWKKPKGQPRKYLRPEELQAFFNAILNESRDEKGIKLDRDASFFGTILLGPCRLGELRQIGLKHVTFVEKPTTDIPPHFMILIPDYIAKDHEDHLLFIFSNAEPAGFCIYDSLRRYYDFRLSLKNHLTPDAAFFCGIRGQYLGEELSSQSWHDNYNRYADRAGIPATTSHCMRHTLGEIAATQLDKRDLQQIFGHTDERTTEIYTHHQNDERLIEARLKATLAVNNYKPNA